MYCWDEKYLYLISTYALKGCIEDNYSSYVPQLEFEVGIADNVRKRVPGIQRLRGHRYEL